MRQWSMVAIICLVALWGGRLEARAEIVPSNIAAAALSIALAQENAPYVWGGQDPWGFDCSGLIIWAYEKAMSGIRLPSAGRGYVTDATMDHLWQHASRPVRPSDVRPGDVVFITGEDGRITHGGLVISVSDTEVEFVNASSYYGEVVVDTWPLEGEKRGQWVVGFGRLIVIPGRRPPMPLRGNPWSASEAAVPFVGAGGAFLQASVSEDGLQSEVAVVQPLASFRVGAGYWSWRDGWRDEQFIAGGDVPFGLIGATVPVGLIELRGYAAYSEAGMSYLAQVSASWPIAGGEFRATAAYRHWAEDPWYSGPTASLGVTF